MMWTQLGEPFKRNVNGHERAFVRCRCQCGREANVRVDGLKAGTSAGCLSCRAKGNTRAKKHGDTTNGKWSPEYGVWSSMLQRCQNPRQKFYAYYGGRGITVCARWKTFANFLVDMGRRPSAEYSIDRIDNDGNYEPGNCRWATAKQQQGNTRRSIS